MVDHSPIDGAHLNYPSKDDYIYWAKMMLRSWSLGVAYDVIVVFKYPGSIYRSKARGQLQSRVLYPKIHVASPTNGVMIFESPRTVCTNNSYTYYIYYYIYYIYWLLPSDIC